MSPGRLPGDIGSGRGGRAGGRPIRQEQRGPSLSPPRSCYSPSWWGLEPEQAATCLPSGALRASRVADEKA